MVPKISHLLAILGIVVAYGAGRATSRPQNSSWLNPKILECKCVMNWEWQLHDLHLLGDDDISEPSFFLSNDDEVVVTANVSDHLLRSGSRDAIRDKLLTRLRRDTNILPTVLWTKISEDEMLEKHVLAVWMSGHGNNYAQFHHGKLTFQWDDK